MQKRAENFRSSLAIRPDQRIWEPNQRPNIKPTTVMNPCLFVIPPTRSHPLPGNPVKQSADSLGGRLSATQHGLRGGLVGSAFMRRHRVRVGVIAAMLGAGSLGLLAGPIGSWVAPEDTARLKNPFGADAIEAVAQGKMLYQNRCVDCHGARGRGDGSAAADLPRRPRDFSLTEIAQQTDGELFWKITEGRRPMPSFSKKLSEDQRWQVVKYLRTLTAKPLARKQE